MCGTQFQQENLFVKSDLTCQKPVERNFYKGKGLPVCCHSCGIFLKGEALAATKRSRGTIRVSRLHAVQKNVARLFSAKSEQRRNEKAWFRKNERLRMPWSVLSKSTRPEENHLQEESPRTPPFLQIDHVYVTCTTTVARKLGWTFDPNRFHFYVSQRTLGFEGHQRKKSEEEKHQNQ